MIDPKEIDDFNNREEEAEFFDTHDFTEFWQEGTPVKPRRTYSEAIQERNRHAS